MKLLTIQFSSASCYFHPLKYNYSNNHPVLKHTQSTVSTHCETSFTLMQNNRITYICSYFNFCVDIAEKKVNDFDVAVRITLKLIHSQFVHYII
jgi:hypothetical protein